MAAGFARGLSFGVPGAGFAGDDFGLGWTGFGGDDCGATFGDWGVGFTVGAGVGLLVVDDVLGDLLCGR